MPKQIKKEGDQFTGVELSEIHREKVIKEVDRRKKKGNLGATISQVIRDLIDNYLPN